MWFITKVCVVTSSVEYGNYIIRNYHQFFKQKAKNDTKEPF